MTDRDFLNAGVVTATGTGTGDLTIGPAVSGYGTITDGYNGDVFIIMGADYEVCRATVTGTALARGTVYRSSNGDALVDWTAGEKTVAAVISAEAMEEIWAALGLVPSGAALPATPTEGQLYVHTPTGRNVLMQYVNGAWNLIQSYGSMTMYVDGTNGTDALDKGTATGADAFATWTYAVAQVPGTYSGHVNIYGAAGTYAETVTIQGKNPTGPYSIYLNGTLAEQETIASCTITAGTGAERGVIHKTGGFDASTKDYTNLLAYFVTDDAYRIIDGHASTISFNSGSTEIAVGNVIKGATSGAFADVLTVTVSSGTWAGGDAAGTIEMLVTYGTWQSGENIDNDTDSTSNVATTASTASANNDKIVIVGLCESSTTQDVKIYDWGTIITSIEAKKQDAVLDKLSIITTANSIFVDNRSFVEAWNCKTTGRLLADAASSLKFGTSDTKNAGILIQDTGSQGGLLLGGAFIDFRRSKIISTGSGVGLQLIQRAYCLLRAETIFEGGDKGVDLVTGGLANFQNIASRGYVRIRNTTTGITAEPGCMALGTSETVFSGNTTDKNPASASDPAYID